MLLHVHPLKAFAGIAAIALATGCGKIDYSSNVLDSTKIPQIIKPTSQGVEIVSGAAVGQRTVLNGYYVDASVGAVFDKLETKTQNGYTVFHGVRGAIVSDGSTF